MPENSYLAPRMILGTGIDIIEVARIEKAMSRDTGFRDKLFTEGEIAYCESKKNRYQHYAARFAAKEAFMKALGTGWRFGVRFADIDLFHDELGQPHIRPAGIAKELTDRLSVSKIHVSLSHLKEMATAIVILECETDPPDVLPAP
ncbi:MAG TPA: holo-ACP synthase [Bacteroidales bacterium]|nr:holo-ACP synthase [Bacteroidales bacterium]HPS62446.1 holo-ACP synthase [Bacteroidales bacterium]